MTVEHKLSKNDRALFLTMSIMVVLYAWITLCATILNAFYAPIIWLGWLGGCVFLYHKKIIVLTRPSRSFISHIMIGVCCIIMISWFTVPTIFSGRDQGSLSEAAIALASHHKLISHSPESDAFFALYGPGRALNFPGFYYTADGGLLTQFPLPYIAFLGGFYGVMGIYGLVVANMILLFLFFCAIGLTARSFMHKNHTIIFLLLLASSFTITWFGKFTLSENLAGALLWGAIALYLTLKDHPHAATYFTLLATIALLLFSRIEGVWFFFAFLSVIFFDRTTRNVLTADPWHRFFMPVALLVSVGVLIVIMNMPFAITIARALLNESHTSATSTPYMTKFLWLGSVYGLYGLLIPLCITLCTPFLVYRKQITWAHCFPFLITFPLFFYYFFPNISADHPWMLRRFMYALAPTTILMSMIIFAHIKTRSAYGKIAWYAIPVIIFLCQLPASTLFLPYIENRSLLPQIDVFAQNFTSRDLLLIDNNAAGNGWSMITAPLRHIHGLHAVYFFNPADLDQLSTDQFERVFLIVPDTKKDLYASQITARDPIKTRDYIFSSEQLDLSQSKQFPPHFPQKQTITTHGTIYQIK